MAQQSKPLAIGLGNESICSAYKLLCYKNVPVVVKIRIVWSNIPLEPLKQRFHHA
jgi:hypothetical protein